MSASADKDSFSEKWLRSRRNFLAAGSLLATQFLAGCLNEGQRQLPLRDLKEKNPSCFLRGTRILTPYGARPVEQLSTGDVITTRRGNRPIRWIARREYRRSEGDTWSREITPIRLRPGSLGPNTPDDDLLISSGHRILFKDVLVRAVDMVNGRSIVTESYATETSLEYFHILMSDHDVIVANGAPAESLLLTPDTIDLFDNANDYLARYGMPDDFNSQPCAPVLTETGGRARLLSHLRRALSPLVDRRDQFDIVRDELMSRSDQ